MTDTTSDGLASYQSYVLGRNYSDLGSIGALLRDNVRMEGARIRSPGKTVFGPSPLGAPQRSNERARHPSAICMIRNMFYLVERSEGDGEGLYLVVKATTAIEVVEECRVGFAAPKVHIGNLEIAPNCVN